MPKEEVAPEEKVEEKPAIQKCADGTLYGQCSTNKPKYCENGNLIDKCSICGCSSGYFCNVASGQCLKVVEPKALDMLAFCKRIKDLGLKNAWLINLPAIATSDISLCGENLSCFLSLAYKNPLACEKIEKLQYYANLPESISYCYLSVGQKTKNPSWCEKIPKGDLKNGCYYYIAPKTGNENLCEKIDLTYGKIEGGYQFGNVSMTGNPIDNCYEKIASSFLKESLCEEIKDAEVREFRCYTTIAMAKSDASICNYIKNSDIKNYCIARVTKNEFLCENLENAKLSTGLPLRDTCYSTIGMEKKDFSLCDQAVGVYRTGCYCRIAMDTLNICNQCGDQDSCYRELAKLKVDASLCVKISDSTDKRMCYMEVAITKKDASICNNVTGDYERSWCIEETAKKLKNPSICEAIEKWGYKDSCLHQSIGPALDLYIEY